VPAGCGKIQGGIMIYLVHFAPEADGSLPPEKWQEVEAASEELALIEGIKLNASERPLVAYVADGDFDFRHPTGAPCVVRQFTMTWG
jgi:hypothetical protein